MAHLSGCEANRQAIVNVAVETFFFSSLGLFFTRQQYSENLKPHWWDTELKLKNFEGGPTAGWDWAINQAVLLQLRPVLQSLAPRVLHKGINGTWSNLSFYQRGYAHAGLYNPSKCLTSMSIHSIDSINHPSSCLDNGCDQWGHLLRLAHQLWSFQRYQLRLAIDLARIKKDFVSIISDGNGRLLF